jgi:hypothetical protein
MALVLVATGCDDSPLEVSQDESAIQQLLLAELESFTVDLFGETTEEGTTPLGKVLAEITPWRFGRQILNVDRMIDIQINNPGDGPATAEVTWNAEITGAFHIIDTQATAYSKDFTSNAVRFATFVKVANTDLPRRGWRLTGISGTEVVSNPASVQIVSVSLSSTGGVDTTFTNVSALVNRENILRFAPLDTVTVTVTTGNVDDVVLLHHPAWRTMHGGRHHVRRMLTNNGDGTHSGTYVVRGLVWHTDSTGNHMLHNPVRHFTVDVLSNGTIFDDVEPYDSVAWGTMYRVQPEL